ncbi:Esterase FE4 [Orchesella cincta]|uniref:Esterase FE4 n=1 Tax=Orchesella cincta TaxID=48709 RepID=A0A1D2MUP2_ORCCI|nr:Esterase FE4 [Orchesella cincta]
MAKRLKFDWITLLVSFCVINAATKNLSPESHLVQTQNGPIQGIVKEARGGAKYVAFLGLRYANPAVRFQPAEPLQEKWETPKVADTFGSVCPQSNWQQAQGDINCLFLNIYVPEKHLKTEGAPAKLPVMFWVHGGGFSSGEGNNYGPEYFMENEDIILVTVNYRLGFLTTGDDIIPSNIGLKDIVEALRFVHENIPAFKGDNSAVLIFGESAGSAAVHYLLMTPAAEGLVNAAILQSGVTSFWSYDPNPRQTAIKLAKESLGCESIQENAESLRNQSLQIRECLEKANMTQLLMSQVTFWPRWPTTNIISRFLPTAEVASESDDSYDPFFASRPQLSLSGKQNVYSSKIPVIIGITADEGATAFAKSVYDNKEKLQQLNSEWNKIAPITFCYEGHFPDNKLSEISEKIKNFYFGSNTVALENKQALADLYSDTGFLLPTLSVANEMARDGMSVYPYIFSYWGGSSIRSILSPNSADIFPGKAGHGDDLQYLFPHPLFGKEFKKGSEQEDFSKAFVDLWTSFAKNGKPTVKGSNGNTIDWKPIQFQNETVLGLELLEIDLTPSIIKLDLKDRIDFWRNLIQNYTQEKEAYEEETTTTKAEL